MKLHSVENEQIRLVITPDELGMLQARLNEARG